MHATLRRIASLLGLLMAVALGAGAVPPDPVDTELDAYVRHDDGAFQWTVESQAETPQGSIHDLKLTSQVWHGITWTHHLHVFEPKPDQAAGAGREAMLLLIGGGENGDVADAADPGTGLALAQACGAACRDAPTGPEPAPAWRQA